MDASFWEFFSLSLSKGMGRYKNDTELERLHVAG